MTYPMHSTLNNICSSCGQETGYFYIELFGSKMKMKKICKCEAEVDRLKEEERRQKEKKKKLELLFKQSRLKARFKSCTFENFKVFDENKHAFEMLLKYASDFKSNKQNSVLLSSSPGTGKTFLACAVVNKLIIQNYAAIVVVVPELLNEIRASYKAYSSDITEDKILSGLSECDLLVMDDIGAERHKEKDDWATEKLFCIINNRYNNMKATIFTTNCSMNDLKLKLGDRAFSRIFEMTEGFRIDLNKVQDLRIFKNKLKEA